MATSLLISCGGAPTGQVVAVVNGEEITLPELNAELSEIKGAAIADKKAVRQQVLQQIIDRRLMAQIAKEEGMDRDPAYIMRERRMQEELLVQMYGAKSADAVRVPDAGAVQKYVQDNPSMFSQRTAYLVDQITFDMPSDQSVLKQLENDKSMAEVEQTLAGLKISYNKGKNSMDSGVVPPAVMKQILALPAGEPFILPAQGKIVVSVITDRKALPVDPKQVTPMAAQSMRAENLGKILRKRLDDAKVKANITYQDGFAPPAKKADKPAAK
jgi:peptidyl-prolyl cis-trans isomerase C